MSQVLRRYLLAAGLARLADEMILPTVVLLALARNDNPVLAGILVGAFTAPVVCSGPVLGAFLDRTRHRAAALACGQLVIAGSALGLAASAGRAPSWVAIGIAALGGLVLPSTSGGFSALIPMLVGRAAMQRSVTPESGPEIVSAPAPGRRTGLATANAFDAATFNVGAIAGPAAAATICAVRGPVAGMVVIAVLAGLSATAALRLPRVSDPATTSGAPSLGGHVRAGLSHLAGSRALLGATVTSAIGFGSVGALAVGFPLYAQELGAPRTSGGYLLTALEIGALLSTATLARHLGRWRPERIVFWCTAAFGVAMACWLATTSFAVALVLVGIAGLVEGPVLPALFAVRQRYSPPEFHGQVSTTAASVKIGAFAVGGGVGGLLAGAVPPAEVILLVAAAQLVGAATGWALAARPR